MKNPMLLAFALTLIAGTAFADIRVTCDTGQTTRQNPLDDVGTSTPLQISMSGTATYTQDMQSHNKTYTLSLPDGFAGSINFSTADGAFKFTFMPSSYQGNWGVEMDVTGPNGLHVTTGSDSSASASLSVNPGAMRSAFVYCNQVK